MARTASGALLPGIVVDISAKEPMSAQLFNALRQQIKVGGIDPGIRMPSTRTLASDLGISRTTVATAYEQLKSEGYLIGKEKSGTFVTDVLPQALSLQNVASPELGPTDADLETDLAMRFDDNPLKPRERTSRTLPFNPGIPAVSEFPSQVWSRLMRPIVSQLAPSGIARCPAEGAIELREQVAGYLANSRGVVCSTDQILIVSGTRQALLLILLGLSNPGDYGWTEDPGYPGTSVSYNLFRVKPVPVPVDGEGLMVDEGIRLKRDAKFAYVTPARQAPLGHTMTIKRRVDLLNWAHETGGYILEDDYDGEYRFGGQPSPSLQSLDPDGRVFYFGTFSKTILPSLGIGYLVVPRRYIETFRSLLDAVSRPPSLATQLTTAEFIATGAFEGHIRKMRSLYIRRQNELSRVFENELGPLLETHVLNAGLHLLGYLQGGQDDRIVANKARSLGLFPRPLSDYTIDAKLRSGLLIGFSNMSEDSMPRASRVLRRAILESRNA